MNGNAAGVIPCDAETLARQMKSMLADKTITVKEKKRERTFSLLPLGENIFMAEDISGDFEMAEELVWWASVGRAFFTRLEENGAVIRRFSPLQEPPETAAEVIPCFWEGELIGRLAVGLPADTADEDRKQEPAKRKPARKTAPAPPETPVRTKGAKPPVHARGEDMESDEAPTETERDGTPEDTGNLARLNKNAARKAYGGNAARTAPKNGKTSGK